jgi:hypothetical protein
MLRDQSKVPCGYFWEKTDKDGKPYWAGVISRGIDGEIPVVIFKEDPKEKKPGAPDFVMRNVTNERNHDTSTR